MPSLHHRSEAALARLGRAIAELEALADFVDPGIREYDAGDLRSVQIAEDAAEAAEKGVAALWDSVRNRINAENRRDAA